ncbi:MAG: hypothetical protein H6510_14395 [Acidobacteria bacterium]|nr:hypothetical protein [Acidobacteriota bacterium]MCB9399000.1 hypothetical protein [Acidobacteriota bacterium]
MKKLAYAMADCLMALIVVMVGVVGVLHIRRHAISAWSAARYREIALNLVDQVLLEDAYAWQAFPERDFDGRGKPSHGQGIFHISLTPGRPSQGSLIYRDPYETPVEIQFWGPFTAEGP